MTAPHPSKTHIGNHKLHPETLMLNYGYDPSSRRVPSSRRSFSPRLSSSTPPRRAVTSSTSSPVGANRPLAWVPGSSIPASITRTARSSKTGSPFSNERKPARSFPPGCRRSPRRFSLSCGRETPSCIRSRFTAAPKRCSPRPFSIWVSSAVGPLDGTDEAPSMPRLKKR